MFSLKKEAPPQAFFKKITDINYFFFLFFTIDLPLITDYTPTSFTPSSFSLVVKVFWTYFLKGWLARWINDECVCKTWELQSWNCRRMFATPHHMSHVRWHVLGVRWHMSCFRWKRSYIYIYMYLFFLTKWCGLPLTGLLSTGPTPSIFDTSSLLYDG